MTYLLGTDEAGYGPNLGPFVVSASLWEVPPASGEVDLYEALAASIGKPGESRSESKLILGDSKLLYRPGGGLAALETGVYGTLGVLGRQAASWRDVWGCLAPTSETDRSKIPWYVSFDRTLPCDADREQIEDRSDRFAHTLRNTNVRLYDLRSVPVFPERWNRLLVDCESKGTVLATETLQLVRRTLETVEPGRTLIQCDKFGGRNRYARLLQTVFPEYLVEIVRESRATSVYRWGPSAARVECRFVAKGESFLPTALASMASKYLRELAMMAFNAFWLAEVPGLKPTAGYPVDARRFRSEIHDAQTRLGIEDHVLWRDK